MTTSILLVYNKFVDPDRLDGKKHRTFMGPG